MNVTRAFLRSELQRKDVIAARVIDAAFDKECIELAMENGLDEYAKSLFSEEEHG